MNPSFRLLLGIAFSAVLCMAATGDLRVGATSVTQAKSAVNKATNAAEKDNSALAQTKLLLQSTEAQLSALSAQIAALNTEIAADEARVAEINENLLQQEYLLENLSKAAYESGTSSDFMYLVASNSINQAVDRSVNLTNIMHLNESTADKIKVEKKQAQETLDQANAMKANLQIKVDQAVTAQVVLASQEEQLKQEDAAAWSQVQSAQNSLNQAEAAAALPQPPPVTTVPTPPPTYSQSGNELYMPVNASTNPFTVLTNLTLPSNETAASLNAFLAGTDLAGLGADFIQAETEYHVNARYFLAHAIEESGWGTSPLAQIKHNLFGYDAYDADPYGDGMTFASDQACILYVAQQISTNYLATTGQFYHGPTLLGMNVDYATDPNWATNIANIANTIPLPAPPAQSS